MTFTRSPVCGRRLFIKRGFVFGIAFGSLLFIEYLLSLTHVEEPACNHSHPAYNAQNCSCATKQQIDHNNDKQAIPSKTVIKGNQDSSMFYLPSLTVHAWSEICGIKVENLRNWPHFPHFPDKTYSISSFYKFQLGYSTNIGERIFGFVHPKTSGKFKFAISSDGNSELWLSPSEDPASSEMIARFSPNPESAWTEEDYEKYPDQISKEITLHAGKKYYIESLSIQGSVGAPHLAFYWSYSPSNTPFEIISSEYLSSFSENKLQDAIPLHAGKQPTLLLQSKREQYHFIRLPFFDRKEYTDFIPICPYIPSFLVRKKLQKYEGVRLPQVSRVFPEDDTGMFKRNLNREWSSPNLRVDKNIVESVINKFIAHLEPKNYFLKEIHKVIHKPDPQNGDRFLLNLELGLVNTSQSFRLSEHVYIKKESNNLCFPEGFLWNSSAKVYFIIPVKDQGKWVYHFINQLTDASLITGDTNFHVLTVDFESKDIDLPKAFNTSLLRSRHTIISLTGKFFKTHAINKAADLVPNAHDIIFLFDLHIDVPADIMENVRMNTVIGKMAYFPIVGRLDCESYSEEHQGFWQMDGYGIMSIYKSDWDRFGGMNTVEYKYKWGEEDWDLVDRVLMLPVEMERIKHPGLYHHYHGKQRKWN